jgi:hypothetical protein
MNKLLSLKNTLSRWLGINGNPNGSAEDNESAKCHLRTARLTKSLLLNAFDNVKRYQDDYHNTKDLKRCKTCGQLYYAAFCEEVDIKAGKDTEYYTFIPVDDMDTGDKLSKLSRLELADYPGIVMYNPPYKSAPHWNKR